MRNNTQFIALVGPIASGKGVIADYLVNKGFGYVKLSDILREELVQSGKQVTRESLQNYGNFLRQKYGGNILAEKAIKKFIGREIPVVIDGVRNPSEVSYLKRVVCATVIGVDADDNIRLERYLKRSVARGEDGLTEEDFYKANDRDLGIGESFSGQQVAKCLLMADINLENNGSQEDLIKQLEEKLPEIRFKDRELHRHQGKERF